MGTGEASVRAGADTRHQSSSISPVPPDAIRDDLLQRAARLVPVLRERAARTEQLRQIPPETVKDLVASGLLRIGNPERYGGVGVDIDTGHAVAWELGRGCGSTAWCASLWVVHNWWLGHFTEQAQEEFFATGPDTAAPRRASIPPTAGPSPCPAAFACSGRWSFSSGCDAATWAMLAVLGPASGTLRWLLIPRARLRDRRHVVRLGHARHGQQGHRGRRRVRPRAPPARSGSRGRPRAHRVGAAPAARAIACRCGSCSGWDLAAPLVGVAQGAVDEFTARLQGTSGPGRTADSVPLQLRLAEASAEVDAARTIHRAAHPGDARPGGGGREFTELRSRSLSPRQGLRHAAVRQAVNRLFEAGGAGAIADSQALQRFHRDVHAASHHAALG